MQVLSEAEGMLGFLLVDDDRFTIDPEDAAKVLSDDATPVLSAASQALATLEQWQTGAIESALRAALVDGLGIKPKHAFGPVRVAVTGRRVSPPLFESLELLGREKTLRRLSAGATVAGS
jgi:glutamyl-tRNA synthetase